MISCVGTETVPFTKELALVGKVEVYLQDLINTMISSLRDQAGSSFEEQPKMERGKWIERDPAQITLLVNNILWSGEVEQGFQKVQGGDMNALKNQLEKQKEGLVGLIKMVQGDLSKPMRQKIMCLITLDTHSRDVVIKLIEEHVRKADEFQWQS